MDNSQVTSVELGQSIETIQPATCPQDQIANPTLQFQNESSPFAIIVGISILIGSITGLVKVLVPVMLKQPERKSK